MDDDELDEILDRVAGIPELTDEQAAVGLQDIWRRLGYQEWLDLPIDRRWVGFWPRWQGHWWLPENCTN